MKKHKLPFTVLADEKFEYFKKFNVEKIINIEILKKLKIYILLSH